LTGDALAELARDLGLPSPFSAVEHYERIAAAIGARRRAIGAPLLAGICGPQGSGKSTMAAFVAAILGAQGLPTAILSLDDLYLDPEDRPVHIHPLFSTRGVPATHDVALGETMIDRLFAGETSIPRFDKATDRRRPQAQWDHFAGPAQIVLFEGWCVGAEPEDPPALAEPINRLEREEDPDGVWRGHANRALASDYRRLFARLGFVVYLAPPSFESVLGWRTRQEEKLRARAGEGAPGVMGAAAIARFVMHYERISRHLSATLPARCDLLVALDADQGIVSLTSRI
jgi:D-glycerate 3-kinase